MKLPEWKIISVILLLCAATVWPYPIPPQTLHALSADSELIVIAQVGTITKFQNERDFDNARAELRVSQVLKGTIPGTTIEVYYPADMVCPAPPHYETGTTVLAFLTARKEGMGYETVSLSYGAKTLTADALVAYVTRLRELAELEQENDQMKRQTQLVEWLVRCAEDPATRWEGTYELLHSHQMKQFQKESGEKMIEGESGVSADVIRIAIERTSVEPREEAIDFVELLNQEQRQRLAAALYDSPSLVEGSMELIEVVETWQDENLLPFVWSYLKAFKQDYPWHTKSLMRRVAKALRNQEALRIIEPFEEPIFTNPEKEAKRAEERLVIWKRFIEIIERDGAPRTIKIKSAVPQKSASMLNQIRHRAGAFSFSGLIASLSLLLARVI